MQQNFQKDPNNDLGFKKYQEIKSMYLKKKEEQKIAKKRRNVADEIAGSQAQSRTDGITEKSLRLNTDFSRHDSDQFGGSEIQTPQPFRKVRLTQQTDGDRSPIPKNEPIASFTIGQISNQNNVGDDAVNAKLRNTFSIDKNKKVSQMILPTVKGLRGKPEQKETQPAMPEFILENQASMFNLMDQIKDIDQTPLNLVKNKSSVEVNQNAAEVIEDDKDPDKNQANSDGSLDRDVRPRSILDELTVTNQIALSKENSVSELKTETNQSVRKSLVSNVHSLEHADTVPVEDIGRYGPKNSMLSTKELQQNKNTRRNSEAFSKLKGLTGLQDNANYIQIDLGGKTVQSPTNKDSDKSIKSQIDDNEDNEGPFPLRRAKAQRESSLSGDGLLQKSKTDFDEKLSKSQLSSRQQSPIAPENNDKVTISEKSEGSGSTSEIRTEKTDGELEISEAGTVVSSVVESKGTLGVHDLLVNEDQWGKPLVERVGKYLALKMDVAEAADLQKDVRAGYYSSDSHVQAFITACLQERQGHQVNPFPILHQLFQGVFIIKNQEYADNMWLFMAKRALDLENSGIEKRLVFSTFYLEDCIISDQTLAQMIKLMIGSEHIQRLILEKMTIGPQTTAALVLLSKSKQQMKFDLGINIELRDCKLVDLQKPLVSERAIFYHPLIQTSFAPIQRLSLVKSDLEDGHLNQLLEKLSVLEFLDVSQNRFTTEGVIHFLQTINSCPVHHMSLKSLNLAANSLNASQEEEKPLQECLTELIQKTFIQHLDLSLTQLKPQTMSSCIKALEMARSIQSLHLTSDSIKNLKSVAEQTFGSFLFNELVSDSTCHAELESTWNGHSNMPDPTETDITLSVASSILGNGRKTQSAQEINSHGPSYGQQRFVLSRLMGRNDLVRQKTWERLDEHDPHGIKQIDMRKDLSTAVLKEVETGTRQPQDLCWVMSQDCWICEMWNYYMPIISKEEIAESYGGFSSKYRQLNEAQEQIFEKMISQEPQAYAKLETAVPYIIGSMTRQKFVMLETFQKHINSIDVDKEKVKAKTGGHSDRMFEHYRTDWINTLTKSSQELRPGQGQGVKGQKKMGRNTKTGMLYPYMPHIDQNKNHEFSEYDVLWSTSLLCKPGKNQFILVYKFDADRVLKAQFNVFMPVRPNLIAHHHILSKVKQKETHEEKEARRDKNYYFDVFRGYSKMMSAGSIKDAMQTDFDHWDAQYSPELQIVGVKAYEAMTRVFFKYGSQLLITYKRLQSESDQFPTLSFKSVCDWAKQIGIINTQYTINKFQSHFEDLKVVDKKKGSPMRRKLGVIQRKNSILNLKSSLNAGLSPSKMNMAIASNKKAATIHSGKEPTNTLARHHFLELLVKISFSKFGAAQEQIQPNVYIERLVKEIILPSFNDNLIYKNPGQTKEWIESKLIIDRDTQKFLFLNQFDLKKIFDSLVEAPKTEQQNDDKNKKRRRQSSMRKSLHRVDSILEEPEEVEGPAAGSSKKIPRKVVQRGKSLIIRTSVVSVKTDLVESEAGSHKSKRTSLHRKRSKSIHVLNAQLSDVGHAHTTKNIQSSLQQIESFSQAYDQKQDDDKDSFFGSVINRNNRDDDEVTNVEEIELDGDTTSINIQTGMNSAMQTPRDQKFMSGTSNFKLSSLKKTTKTNKKNLRIQIEPKFLPKGGKDNVITFDKLWEMIQKSFPDSMKKLVTMKSHYHSFAWVKLPQKCLGNTQKAVEDYKNAVMRINFVEFMVYLCVLGKEINRLQVISGYAEMTPSEGLNQVLTHVMPANNHELQKVPENDTRGLAEYAQDILLNGQVKKYENENEIQVCTSVNADMFTDSENEEEDRQRQTMAKTKKVFKDKWEALADEKAKNQPAEQQPLDPSQPNEELLAQMLDKRHKRDLREEWLKEQELNRGNDSDDEDEY